jgi:hypothetical protein
MRGVLWWLMLGRIRQMSLMLDPIDLQSVLAFARPYLTTAELTGFELHATGKATGSVDLAHGWVIYWGFADYLADCRSFADHTDSDYEKGRILAANYLASQRHVEPR